MGEYGGASASWANIATEGTTYNTECQDYEDDSLQSVPGRGITKDAMDEGRACGPVRSRRREQVVLRMVLQYDSEYRVNDVVSLQGLNYKLTSQSLLTRPEYQGTILRRMLESKPKHPNSNEIMWHENDREEAQENFEFILDSVKNMDCGANRKRHTLGALARRDSVGTAFKEIPDTDAAARKVVEYAKRRPGDQRIEISGVLHFGVPDPDDASYAGKRRVRTLLGDASGLPPIASQMTTCRKMVKHPLTVFSRKLRRVEWRCGSTSSNNLDTDMCRHAKACHYVSARHRTGGRFHSSPRSEAHTQGTPSAICLMICTGTFASAMND